MKSLNTKKIVAMATGAALLGSALLGAVSYQNTELINENGVPMAKVVVGSNAHISDGVAAANIAAVLGNMAFKHVDVSATVDGVAGLSCDVSGEGAGTCSVLSKSVDLEVVTPAGTIPAGAFSLNTYIWDWIDSNTRNRKDDDSYRRITASDFPALADFPVIDPQSSYSTTQKQYIYVRSWEVAEWNIADEVFRAEGVDLRYQLRFESPGLPVCTDDYNTFDCDSQRRLDRHRVHVKFLGEEWVVSEVNYDNSADEIRSIKLAKESAYEPRLQIGESMDLKDGNRLVLGDLKPASGQQDDDIAIFNIFNAADEIIASQTVMAGDTVEVTAGGDTYSIRVYQAAPGYTLTEKWAEVAVYANELELEDGKELEDNDDEVRWDVEFKLTGAENTRITEILLKRDVDYLEVGESFGIVEEPTIWRFTFTGLNLGSNDYNRIVVSSQSSSTTEKYYDCSVEGNFGSRNDCTEYLMGPGALIRISADSNIFQFNDHVEGNLEEIDTIFVKVFDDGDAATGDIFWRSPVGYHHIVGGVEYYDGEQYREFFVNDISGDPNAAMVSADPGWDGTHALVEVGLWEYDGHYDNAFLFTVIEGTTSNRWRIDGDGLQATDGDSDVVWAIQSGTPMKIEVDNVQYTTRGSYVQRVRATGLEFYGAKEVGELQFLLQETGAVATAEGVVPHDNLQEGDTINVLGAEIRVKNINVETSECVVAGGEGVVTGIEGLSCVINANVANLGERQDIPTDLVIMDRAAANVETLISVGGPMVNTITEALLAGETPLNSPGDTHVAEVGAGKIVVAGYTADDTMAAAMNFIAQLKGQ